MNPIYEIFPSIFGFFDGIDFDLILFIVKMIWIFPNDEIKIDFSSSSLHPRSEDSWILERMREGELKDLMIKKGSPID